MTATDPLQSLNERNDRLVSMRTYLLILTFLVVGCAPVHERVTEQLVRDNRADDSEMFFGWYHNWKATDEFEPEARACAAAEFGKPGTRFGSFYPNRARATRSTVTAIITDCLFKKGWKLRGDRGLVIVIN